MIRDLSRGTVGRTLVRFTLPVLGSVVFQQAYTMSDSIVAGQMIGPDALAAVGASYPITMLLLSIAVGANVGCSVLISRQFGERDYGGVRAAANTSFVLIGVISAVLTILGLLTCRPLLRAMQTPEIIMGDASAFLTIYMLGLTFLIAYNIMGGIFSALGDSSTMFAFLILSSVSNIGLNILFVGPLRMGVPGLGWATLIAQGVSAMLALYTLLRRLGKLPASGDKAPIYSPYMMRAIRQIAVPSAMQSAFVTVGGVFIQGLINSYGTAVIAGYACAARLNGFAVVTMGAFSNSLTSFTAQNLGAGSPERVRRAFWISLWVLIGMAAVFCAVYTLAGTEVASWFTGAGAASSIDKAKTFLRFTGPFYWTIALKLACDGVLRGGGGIRIFTACTFVDLGLRVAVSYILAPFLSEQAIWLSWPVGWTISSLLAYWFMRKMIWRTSVDRSRVPG